MSGTRWMLVGCEGSWARPGEPTWGAAAVAEGGKVFNMASCYSSPDTAEALEGQPLARLPARASLLYMPARFAVLDPAPWLFNRYQMWTGQPALSLATEAGQSGNVRWALFGSSALADLFYHAALVYKLRVRLGEMVPRCSS